MAGVWPLPEPRYPTAGIVSVRYGKTDLDRRMEAWAREKKCTCGRHPA